MTERRARGDRAEQLAVDHLVATGHAIEARNWSCREGELDIVARRGDVLVIVEVRSASTDWLRSPTVTVSAAKQKRVARAAERYLAVCRGARRDLRFDVIGVRFVPDGPPQIEHIENAFTAPWAY